jgi:hypothetical protein
MTNTTPAYEHDCKRCIFLGADFPRHHEARVNQVDNYIHLNPSGRHTIVRRFSSLPSDYVSFKPTELDPNRLPPNYRGALDLARVRGFI